jgi:hypothetical protein
MDLPETEKYDVIISISTIEHIGQEESALEAEPKNLEAPLKAIAKIYDLLNVGGKALITVPFGKLINARWFIQFSREYINLLATKYEIPDSAISKTFLKRIATELGVENPRHLWIQVEEEELSEVEFNWPWPFGNGILVLELTKLSTPFSLNLNLPPEPWIYGSLLSESISSSIAEQTYSIFARLREINLVIFPKWSEPEELLYANLKRVIQTIFEHPHPDSIALLIDTTNIDEEDANLIVSDIIMNIFAEEALDSTDEPEIILLGKLNQILWQVLLPRINSRVNLETENESAIMSATAQGIPVSTVESLGSKRSIQLETGLWVLK